MERTDYQQQDNEERRYAEEHPESFAAYWRKREQDLREQREFWDRWDRKFNKEQSK